MVAMAVAVTGAIRLLGAITCVPSRIRFVFAAVSAMQA